jgi:prevent-host-death family protein
MAKIAVIDARKDLADILNRAAYGKERVVLTRRGKDVAAIVPMDDLNILEAIEDDCRKFAFARLLGEFIHALEVGFRKTPTEHGTSFIGRQCTIVGINHPVPNVGC